MIAYGSRQNRKSGDSADIQRSPGRAAAAFTLVELLIVLALSALLLALLFGPIVQGFRLTNRARAQVAAQDATRFGIENFARELREAAFVFDNTSTPITLPLEATDTSAAAVQAGTKVTTGVTRKNTYQTSGSNSIVVPLESYGRIDFIPAAIRTDSLAGATSATDPTTNLPVNGGQLRLTGAAGTKYVRYWIGLRRNYTLAGTTVSKSYYDNVYEFPRTDTDLNAFVLWRAEYDPTDPNLVAQVTVTDPVTGKSVVTPDLSSSTVDGNGMNDPDFFYNLNAANTTNALGVAGNGKTYAENWRAAATSVISGTNLDLLSWRRDSHRAIITSSPIETGVTFTPSAIVGDSATPGFTSATQAEDPSAVPSLYTTQYGQWTLPFTLTVYRGSTQYQPTAGVDTRTPPLYGSAALSFTVDPTTGDLLVSVSSSQGTLAMASGASYYWMRSASTGKIFVSLPNLTINVDPARGRVETGLPPLATQTPSSGGAPWYYSGGSTTPTAMAPSSVGATAVPNGGNEGELVQTAFTESTLHRLAGSVSGASAVPLNQGILYADLSALAVQPVDGNQDRGNYYALSDTTHATAYVSPFLTFGGASATTLTNYHGAMIVAGSERVTGPDNQVFEVTTTAGTSTDPNLASSTVTSATNITGDVAYTRVPSAAQSLGKEASIITSDLSNGLGVYVRRSPVTYKLIQDLQDFNRPYLLFDDAGGKLTDPRNQDPLEAPTPTAPLSVASLVALGPNVAGLPAGFSTDTTAAHDRKIQITYLWQNNYSRTPEGRPVSAAGQTELSQTNTAIQPEPDVVKADYSSRTLININLAVRVYDSSTGQPQISQVTDKIRVSNVAR